MLSFVLESSTINHWSLLSDGVDASDIILFESGRAKSGFVNQLNKLSTLLLDQLLHRLEYYRETGWDTKFINLNEKKFKIKRLTLALLSDLCENIFTLHVLHYLKVLLS